METLPEDLLICILLFVAPRTLRHASCVCKRWNALLNSEYMKSMRFRERWHNYATGQLLPVQLNAPRMLFRTSISMGDDGKVYTLCHTAPHGWHVLCEGRIKSFLWIHGQDLFGMCPTFAVVGTRIYFRQHGLLRIYNEIRSEYVKETPWKILSSNGKVYALCRRKVIVIEGFTVTHTIECGTWLDFVVLGDTLFGTHGSGTVVMWRDGVFTDTDMPHGILVVHKDKLYSLHERTVYTLDSTGLVTSLCMEDEVFGLTFVGDTMCVAGRDSFRVCDKHTIEAKDLCAIIGTDTELTVLKNQRAVVKYV
jgi:hypothetical protein